MFLKFESYSNGKELTWREAKPLDDAPECPICGSRSGELYRNKIHGEIVGCESCVEYERS